MGEANVLYIYIYYKRVGACLQALAKKGLQKALTTQHFCPVPIDLCNYRRFLSLEA